MDPRPLKISMRLSRNATNLNRGREGDGANDIVRPIRVNVIYAHIAQAWGGNLGYYRGNNGRASFSE